MIAEDFTSNMTDQKKSATWPYSLLCWLGIIVFGCLSVVNGSTHVLPLTGGDMLRAILFCMPFLIIGFTFEYFIDNASVRTRRFYDWFIRFCAALGAIGFTLGVTFDAYDPFPGWNVEWLAITLTAQVAIEVAFIHACYNWIKQFRNHQNAVLGNTYRAALEAEKQAFEQQKDQLQNEHDESESNLEFLIFQHARAGHAISHDYLLSIQKELSDELANDEAELDFLNYGISRNRSFEQAITH